MKSSAHWIAFLGICLSFSGALTARNASDASNQIKVTFLGTGTPYPSADRFGASILVEAGGKKLLFDCGRGAVIRLTQAGLSPRDIDAVFLTHLHSDHIVGFPDLWLTGWFLGRDKPLELWGPAGTIAMAQHLAEAYSFDIQTRESTEQLPAQGVAIDAHETSGAKILNEGPLRVTAFLVDHGPVKPALGYRVDYANHSVVISGDTKFSQNLVDAAKGADCLLHVAWTVAANNPTPPSQRSIATAEDAARAFSLVRPRLAVVYHYRSEAGLASALRAGYSGPFLIAHDLTTISIGSNISWRNAPSSGAIPSK